MKYKNANNILPAELIEKIQQYVQGEYIYIPIKGRRNNAVPTEYRIELNKRDCHIYTKSLEGLSTKAISEMFNLSQSSIRRIIINQRRRYEAMKDRIKNILGKWNIEDKKIEQIYDTAWQIGEKYVLKVYENCEMLERNIKVSRILEDMNIPVGKVISTGDNKKFARDKNYYYILTEKLHGNNIVTVSEALSEAVEIGKIIAKLHVAFRECEVMEEFWDNSLMLELTGWIKDTLQADGWRFVGEKEFNITVNQLEKLYAKLPVQLIHRDVHFGNFLFSEGKFSGYIDFDLSQRNIRIFDLCYFMTGLLSEEEAFKVSEEEWFKILEGVFEGYQNLIVLNEAERKAVPCVMKGIELLFTAWFIGQEDIKCVENAVKIFEFVDKNTDRILRVLNENCSKK